MTREYEIYLEGRNACFRKSPNRDNPYQGSPAKIWADGWFDALEETLDNRELARPSA